MEICLPGTLQATVLSIRWHEIRNGECEDDRGKDKKEGMYEWDKYCLSDA